jgi:hypothetical protein
MLRKTMIVLAMAAALTGGLTADALARGGGGGGHGGGFGGGAHMGGFGAAALAGAISAVAGLSVAVLRAYRGRSGRSPWQSADPSTQARVLAD